MNIKQYSFGKLLLLGAMLFLTSCASDGMVKSAKPSSFAFLNSYDMALRDYQAGKVMEARARVLAMDKEREDYPQAKKLLENKLNPARIRLLRYYKAKGKKAEKAGRWVKAMRLYQQAAEFSTKPEIFVGYVKRMDMNMRQKRMDTLLKQRRAQDHIWMQWRYSYKPPRGIAVDDRALHRMKEHIEDSIEDRVHQAYRDAKYYLSHHMAGVAYIEAETYLRFMPDSEKGQRLMQEVKEAMPKALRVKRARKTYKKKGSGKQQAEHKQAYTKKDIQHLMKKGEWLKARNAAVAYRRNDGKDADRVLKTVDAGMKKAAASWFAKGSAAFRIEHIDDAVKAWGMAVKLQPNNSEYIDALRRAKQLQEHLHLLRDGK